MNSTNAEVAQAWKDGRAAANNGASLRTNGRSLYSYALCIGKTDPRTGAKIAFFARAPFHFVSRITNAHVGYAMRAADLTLTDQAKFESYTQETE